MTLLELATEIANKKYDGHFTLMKFTTNWRFCFGTVDYDGDVFVYRDNISRMAVGETLDDSIMEAIKREIKGEK